MAKPTFQEFVACNYSQKVDGEDDWRILVGRACNLDPSRDFRLQVMPLSVMLRVVTLPFYAWLGACAYK